MSLNDELRRMVALLQKTLRRAGLTQRQVSVRLGQHPNYLSQVFAGKARLKEDLVFRVLRHCGVAVEDFYAELALGNAPAAGTTAAVPGPRPEAAASAGPVTAVEARRFIREALATRDGARVEPPVHSEPVTQGAERRREQLEGTRHSARVKALLRAKIRRAGLRQRDISRGLGEHPDYLSQVLRGNVVLKTEHVLAVLSQLEIAPAAFYGELYAGVPEATSVADPARELVRGVTWGEILALIDSELEASARRRGDRGASQPTEGRGDRGASQPAEGRASTGPPRPAERPAKKRPPTRQRRRAPQALAARR